MTPKERTIALIKLSRKMGRAKSVAEVSELSRQLRVLRGQEVCN